MVSTLLGLFLGVAHAGGWEPVVDRDAGALRLALAYGTGISPERDLGCGERVDCDASWERTGVQVEGQVVLWKGVAVFGGLGRSQERVPEANYRGVGPSWGGGLRLSVPLPMNDWYLAGQAALSWAWGEGGGLDTGGVEAAWAQVHDVSAAVAWGNPADGLSLWAGGETSWYWQHRVQPLGYVDNQAVLDLRLVPAAPGTLLVGASVTSQGLGTGWNRSTRISTGLTLRYGQTRGFSTWIALRY